MKLLLKSLKSAYAYSIEMSQRKRTLNYLQTLTDYNLIDKGYAPHLIAEGLSAYPWTAVEENLAPLNLSTNAVMAQETAVEETTHFRTAA